MDIKEKIEQIVSRLTADKTLMTRFNDDPVSVLEELLGVDLPNDKLDDLIDGIKAKIKLDNIGGALGGLGGLFGKK